MSNMENNNENISNNTVPDWLTKEYLENIFKKYKKCDKLKIQKLIFIPATGKGDNYTSIITRIKLNFNLSGNSNDTKNITPLHSYIVKSPYENNFINGILKKYKAFECELNMYKNVLPKLTEILRRINKNEYISPEIIYVDVEHMGIIMEDLSATNYIIKDRIARFDFEHTISALRVMAKIHAASLILNKELGENNYLRSFDCGLVNRNTRIFEVFFKSFVEDCGDLANSIGGEYKIYGEKLKKLKPYCMDKFETACDVFENDFNVLNHGDFWTNNIMFKYNDNVSNSKEIENIVLIDFQYSKWTSPAWDLHYFFNTSLKEELRYKSQNELFQFYYNNLIDTLKKLKYSDKVPDFKEFQLQMAKREFIGLVIMCSSQVLLINESTEDAEFEVIIADDERAKKFRKTALSNPNVKQALKNMLPIFNERGLLDI